MGKKNTGLKVVVALLVLAFGASVTYSAVPAVKEWTDGIIDKIVVRPSEYVSSEEPSSEAPSEDLSEEDSEVPSSEEPSEELVLLEEWHFKFSKEQNVNFFYDDQSTYYTPPYSLMTNYVADLNTITFIFEDISEIVPVTDYIGVLDSSSLLESAPFDYSDIDFGLYDFSEIVITAQDQVLTPIYTPIYVE